MTWKVRRVQDLANLINGFPFDSSDFSSAGDLPLIRIRDVLAQSFETYISESVVPDTALVRDGDVVIGMDGDFNLVHWSRGRAALNQRLCILRDNGEADSRFLAYALPPYLQKLNDLTYATTVKHLSSAQVRAIRLQIPGRQTQQAIADYLDRETTRIETLIEEQRRLIEMLRERRAAVISSALRPTDSWVSRRIKHIGETSLGKMLDAGRAVRDGDQPRPYVRAADVRADGSVNLQDLNEMPFSDAEMALFDLRKDDVLLIEGGATVGRPGFMFESAPGTAFQKTVNRLRVGPQTDARFVYWSMLRLYESDYYANHFGSVSFVHLTGEKLREIELHLPSPDEQRTIAVYLDEQTAKLEALIAETERFIELARERRAALITAAVTGQIDAGEMA